jgi:hypothetical protein
MSRGLIFWVLMLVWFVFVLVGAFTPMLGHYGSVAGSFFEFILFLLLGWRVYGAPIHE